MAIKKKKKKITHDERITSMTHDESMRTHDESMSHDESMRTHDNMMTHTLMPSYALTGNNHYVQL